MNFRQVHLDFHTSELIPGIGSRFSKEDFQNALKTGHVNSITVFSKCHHGWAYHPSKANETHPNLSFDLLKAEIEAAHEIGVKTPVYISAGLDEKIARKHPEWLMRNIDETMPWAGTFDKPGYHRFCFNTPYLDVLLAQIAEVVANYDCDGIFLDIVGINPCYCQYCVAGRRAEGVDPYDPDAAYTYAVRTYRKYTAAVRAEIDKYKPGLPVFHNAGHIQCGDRETIDADSHLELESLPTGGWGYDHFPVSAAYVRGLGKDFLGMTGKFHLSWGEFGGFKHPNALRYEVALDAALGAKMSIGDQLHPSGKFDEATYKLIGAAYSEIEKKEPWLDRVTAVTDIAILSQEAVCARLNPGKEPPSRHSYKGNTGATRILLEGNYLFDVADTETDLSKYKVVILPDDIGVDGYLKNKLLAFVGNGGKLLATGRSLVNDAELLSLLGAEYKGECEFCPAYIRPCFELKSLPDAAFVIYNRMSDISAAGEVLCRSEYPYFNRTVFSFSSHQHTPNDPSASFPAATAGKGGVFCVAPLFTEYALKGSLVAKEIVIGLLDRLLGEEKTLVTDLPAQGVSTLMEQKDEHRYVLHQLYASPVKRGSGVEVIEDIVPLYGLKISVRTEKTPKKLYLAPGLEEIPFKLKDGRCEFILPRLELHAMIVMEY